MTLTKSAWRCAVATQPAQTSSQNSSQNFGWQRLLLLALAACCCLPTTGCLNPNRPHALGNLVDGMYSNFRERVWAHRAFNQQYGHMPRKFREHFRKGYVEGFCNVCNGGDGYIPAMPPKEYWGYEFQSADGAECVSSWFDGYPEGVAAARKASAGKNADMYISNMIERAVQQEKNGVRLASDVKITGSGATSGNGETANSKATIEEVAPPAPSSTDAKRGTSQSETNSPAALLTPLAPLKPAEPSMVIGQGDF